MWTCFREWASKLSIAGLAVVLSFIGMAVFAPPKGGAQEPSLGVSLLALGFLASLLWFVVLALYRLYSKIIRTVRGRVRTVASKKEIKRKMLEILSDGVVTEQEDNELRELVSQLGMDEEYYRKIREEFLQSEIRPIIAKIQKTRRLSPEDDEKLSEIAKAHRIDTTFQDDLFERYRQLWKIEATGEYTPTPIRTTVRLQPEEVCYFEASSTWRQEKTIRKNTGYVGGSIGFKVAKGVTLRVGKATPTYREYDQIVDISDGMLYVTNKKIVFVGTKKSTSITFGRLADYELYRDAIRLHKTSGKPDIFALDEDDILLLDALLQSI